jgi:hypothetical protein
VPADPMAVAAHASTRSYLSSSARAQACKSGASLGSSTSSSFLHAGQKKQADFIGTGRPASAITRLHASRFSPQSISGYQ